MAGSPLATERILSLAAYVKDRGRGRVSLGDITRDVPGYDDGSAPRDTTGELVAGTKEWESLRKRVARDLADLAAHWGVQIEWVEIEKSYVVRSAFFSKEERIALIAAAAAVEVEGPGPDRPGELGSAVDDAETQVVVRIPELVLPLRAAIATRTPVRFRHDGRERTLQPYALGQWSNRWYVAGWSEADSAMRRFRLDRIELRDDADPIELVGDPGSYEIGDWFRSDLAFDMDPNSWGRDPVLHARIRIDADHVPVAMRDLGGEIVESDSDSSTIALTVRHYQWTRDRLLALRDHARVLDPPALVAMMRDHLGALAGEG